MHHELQEGLRLGLPGASSIEDPTISTFSRGELPHFAGINTFLKAPYGKDLFVRDEVVLFVDGFNHTVLFDWYTANPVLW
jgi:hypothetical protein